MSKKPDLKKRLSSVRAVKATSAVKEARKRKKSEATPAPRRMPRARETFTDAEIEAAQSYEERGLFCLRVLTAGQWGEQEERLKAAWKITTGALYNYRRTAAVARAAVSDEDAAKRLEIVLAGFRADREEHEELAKFFRSSGRFGLATKHDDLARKALVEFAEIAGLRQVRISHSIEADPRVAGFYQAVLAALEDFDRMRSAYIAEVEKLTGGVLPALPSAHAHVRDAAKRYEAEIGARSEARKLAA